MRRIVIAFAATLAATALGLSLTPAAANASPPKDPGFCCPQ
jgi:Spy/CpxP family protein refolding chaperone